MRSPSRCQVLHQPLRPRTIEVPGQHQTVGRPRGCAATRGLEMLDHLRAEIEGRHPHVARIAEPVADQGVDHRERLNRLWRVEVVAPELVGEVESRPHDRHSPDRAGRRPRTGHRLERDIDAIVHEQRRVRGQAAVTVHGSRRERVACIHRLRRRRAARRHRLHARLEKLSRLILSRRCRGVDARARDHAARELQALVVARRRNARDEVVHARAQGGLAFSRTRKERVQLAVRRPGSLGERRSEQDQVNHRVFIALHDALANRSITGLDPAGPHRFELLRRAPPEGVRE